MTLLRSNVEFAKRVFLDRLTTDQQKLDAPNNIDWGPGDTYEYSNCFDPFNFGVGADCSGLCGIMCGAAIFGPQHMVWGRLFSTETFYAWANNVGGWKQTTKDDCVNGSYAIKVMIMHGGGGPDSHMAMWLDGIDMESNGDHGTCTLPADITGLASDYWNDWYVYTEPIIEDTTWRQPMSYPKLLDYAGGVIPGAVLAANGITAVCRYINPGGSSLPAKQMQADEFIDLCQNNIGVVFNYETTATFELVDNGATDAQWAQNYIGGLLNAAAASGISVPPGYQPKVYFSADFDESPDQDAVVESYLSGAASVLGGLHNVGLYGAYYICKRAEAALGADLLLWQTEAWSGGNIVSSVNIMQRNGVGYLTLNGVQCDIDEAHTDDYGAFFAGSSPVVPQPDPQPSPQPSGPTTLDSTFASLSRYASNGISYSVKDYVMFTDARTHEAEVERYALLGDPASVKLVQAAANNGDTIAALIAKQIPSSTKS